MFATKNLLDMTCHMLSFEQSVEIKAETNLSNKESSNSKCKMLEMNGDGNFKNFKLGFDVNFNHSACAHMQDTSHIQFSQIYSTWRDGKVIILNDSNTCIIKPDDITSSAMQ